ncbi:hypothetical protein BASA81_015735 [Batrachochytrium salamandrivorans]|nr:hypothetical protein BASA81_015735 [Batrachochytrium salamandrivorans]
MLVTKHSANREAVLLAACEGKGQLLAKLLVEKWCLQPDADLLAVLQQVCKVNALSSLVLTRKQSQQNDDGVQACHVLEKLVARRKLTPYETSAVVGALSRLRCRKLAHAMLVNLS